MSVESTRTRLVLASASPRRRELMGALDVPVELVATGDAEGSPRAGESPREFVLRLALEKALEAAIGPRHAIVIGADTAVLLDGDVLGKPLDMSEASQMLRKLRGRVHTVVTGVAALDSGSGRWVSAARSTEVSMRPYSDREIASYVASGEPLDKAGGYAVQDEGFHPAADIHGCYLNVVGFPLCEVMELLDQLGLETRLRRGWQPPRQCQDCPLHGEEV